MIYLDNNATTQPADEVVAAMIESLRSGWANPSSGHRAGQVARQQLELARHAVARLINAADRQIVFTSGGSEAAVLAVRGAVEGAGPESRIVTTRIEHSAVRDLAADLEPRGHGVTWIGCDRHGVVDIEAIRTAVQRDAGSIAVVSVMWANNETGVIQPIEQVGAICREHGVRFHCDGTQAVGRLPCDVATLPVDLLSFSAHKFHGPKGAGALFVRDGVRLRSQSWGGPQERQRRGGTESTTCIVGFGVAADLARRWLETGEAQRIEAMRDRFERALLGADLGASINGGAVPRLWSTSSVAFADLEAEAILLALSERGVCVSAGAACASGGHEPSAVLAAMGIPTEAALGSIRFSLSRHTSDSELDRAIEVVAEVIEAMRQLHAART